MSTSVKKSGPFRRQFIQNEVTIKGLVSYAEVFRRCGKVSRTQLQIDADLLKRSGFSIGSGLKGREGYFFSTASTLDESYDLRLNHRPVEKNIIARTAGWIAVYSRPTADCQLNWINKRLFGGTAENIGRLEGKLKALSPQDSRRVYLDGGTTVSRIAEHLGKINPIRKSPTRIARLDVWTNSRHTFYQLGDPDYSMKMTIGIIGGYQLKDTGVIGGDQAISFVETIMPKIDITFMGASLICNSDGIIYTGNEEEASIKRAVIQQSSFVVAVADSSKFTDFSGKHPVASLDEGLVDLIITDKIDEQSPPPSDIPVPVLVCTRRTGDLNAQNLIKERHLR